MTSHRRQPSPQQPSAGRHEKPEPPAGKPEPRTTYLEPEAEPRSADTQHAVDEWLNPWPKGESR